MSKNFDFDKFEVKSYDVPMLSEDGQSCTMVRTYKVQGYGTGLDRMKNDRMAREVSQTQFSQTVDPKVQSTKAFSRDTLKL